MAKRKYRADDVKVARVDGLVERVVGDRVFVGIDVAKKDMYAAVVDEALRVASIVKWKHPDECSAFIAYLAQLRDLGLDVEVVMEPSGVYGDALRYQVQQAGFTVFRVQPKRVHDAMEVFDGVPSLHDPKSAVIIAKLTATASPSAGTREATTSGPSTPICASSRSTKSSSRRTASASMRSLGATGPSSPTSSTSSRRPCSSSWWPTAAQAPSDRTSRAPEGS